jgi:N utilization substance protein B
MSKIQLNAKSIARIASIQTMYQIGNNQNDIDIDTSISKIIEFYKDNDINDYDLDKNTRLKLKPSVSYLQELVSYTHKNLNEIDEIITQHLTGEWSLKNLPTLLLAILRVALCEMKYFPETPRNVIINEYTNIASEMLDTGEIGFVNSILDKYASEQR